MRHRDTIIFTIVNLSGCILPSIISVFYFLANNKLDNCFQFYKEGQLFIYSASLLTSSVYILFSWKRENNNLLTGIFWIAALLLFISSVLYSFYLAGAFSNYEFLKNGSLIIFGVTIVIYYYSNYQNTQAPDVIDQDHQAINEIMQDL